MAKKPVIIRLSTENADKVKRALKDLGQDGKRALSDIERAGRPASRGLRIVNAAAVEANKGVGHLSAQAGGLARVSAALGPIDIALGVGAGAATALAFAARNAAREIADIGDAADRAGVNVETFEQLRAALFQVGQGDRAGTLEAALSAINKRIGEARSGVSEAVKVFDALDIALEDTEGARSFEAVLGDIADRFQDMDEAQRRALGQKLGEETFRSLIPVMQQGSEGLARMREEAHQLGLLYGGETIRNAQQLNAAFDKQSQIIGVQLKSAYLGAGPTILSLTENVAAALPVIVAFTDAVVSGIVRLGELGGLTEAPLERQLERKREMLSRALEIEEMINQSSDDDGISKFADKFLGLFGIKPTTREESLKTATANVARLVGEVADLRTLIDTQNKAREALANLGKTGTGSGLSFDLGTGGASEAKKGAFETALEQVARQVQAQEMARLSIGKSAGETARLKAETQLLTAAKKEFGQVSEENRVLAEAVAGQLAQEAQMTADATEREKVWAEATRKRAQAQVEAARVTTQAIERVGDVLAQVLTGATSAWRNLLAIALQSVTGSGPFGPLVNKLLGVTGGGLISSVAGINAVIDPTAGAVAGRKPGAAFGADFMVGGAGGVDSKMLMMPVTPGERVRVDPAPGRGGAGGQQVVINQSFNWTITGSDEAAVAQVLEQQRHVFAADAEAAAVRAMVKLKTGARGTLGRIV